MRGGTPRPSFSGQKSIHYSIESQTYCTVAGAESEGGRHGEAEGLARLPQSEIGAKGVDRLCVAVVSRGLKQERSCRAREHATRDRGRSRSVRIQAQRVVGPVDTERRVN